MPVCGMDIVCPRDNECQDGGNLQNHHRIVSFRRLADAAHQNYRQDHYHQECREVEAQMQTRSIKDISLEITQTAG